MRLAIGITAVVTLAGLHLAALYALLHPKVSREYRAHYIDKVTMDWHPQHYPSTPEEGIDLSKPGWPDFVEYSFGISNAEKFGSWTDTRMGLKSGFEFNRSFIGPVCVVLNAMPADSMRSRRVPLEFGDQQKEIAFEQDQSIRSYFADFDLTSPATRLALHFPKPLPSGSHENPRQVGVALNRIRIFSQPCAALSQLLVQGH